MQLVDDNIMDNGVEHPIGIVTEMFVCLLHSVYIWKKIDFSLYKMPHLWLNFTAMVSAAVIWWAKGVLKFTAMLSAAVIWWAKEVLMTQHRFGEVNSDIVAILSVINYSN
jgi:hypothetical protein